MEGNFLVTLAGVLLSILFGYVGGFKTWYEAQDSTRKAQIMLCLTALAALIVAGGSCWLKYPWITCDESGLKELLRLFFLSLTANQVAYLTLVKPRRA